MHSLKLTPSLPALLLALASFVCLVPAYAQPFSFSQPDDTDKQEQAARATVRAFSA